MKLNTLKYAALGTVAAGALFSATNAVAQETDTGDVTATILNSFTLTETTSMNFGTMVMLCDTGAASTANIVLDETTSAGTISNNGNALIIDVNTAARTRAVYDVTGAAPTTVLNITLTNPVNLTCPACVGTPSPITLGTLVASTGATGTTDGAGALQFGVGATLTTAGTCGANQYEDGVYTGTYDVTVGY